MVKRVLNGRVLAQTPEVEAIKNTGLVIASFFLADVILAMVNKASEGNVDAGKLLFSFLGLYDF